MRIGRPYSDLVRRISKAEFVAIVNDGEAKVRSIQVHRHIPYQCKTVRKDATRAIPPGRREDSYGVEMAELVK
jgi:hypothetical protein